MTVITRHSVTVPLELLDQARAKVGGTEYLSPTDLIREVLARYVGTSVEHVVRGRVAGKPVSCGACGETGHYQTNRRLCTKHPNYVTPDRPVDFMIG